MKRASICIFGLCVLVGFFSCEKKPIEDPAKGFDRKAMLIQYSDSLIIPAYTQFQNQTRLLKTDIEALAQNPTSGTLTQAKQNFQQTYILWQSCEGFEIGPADDKQAHFNLNYFPTDTATIKTNINNSVTNVSSSLTNTKGLPAIEYLLYHPQILTLLTGSQADAHKNYLRALINEVVSISEYVVSNWSNYRNSFINATGTDVGSGLSLMVNALAYQLDLTKRHRVGVPAGYNGNTPTNIIQLSKAEAPYSNQSIILLKTNLEQLKTTFKGGNGLGLDNYLDHINAKVDGQNLSTIILAQMDVCLSITQQMTDLKATLQNNPALVDNLFLELKKLLIYLKVDVPSYAGVAINYADGDSD